MDATGVLLGFVIGAVTGAAGSYLGQKYTDRRRLKEHTHELDKEWLDVCRRFSNVINEMREDVDSKGHDGTRQFFVKSSKSVVNSRGARFEYHTDKHANLEAAIRYLEELGYIEDITEGNCPKFRMREHFVDLLRTNGSAA